MYGSVHRSDVPVCKNGAFAQAADRDFGCSKFLEGVDLTEVREQKSEKCEKLSWISKIDRRVQVSFPGEGTRNKSEKLPLITDSVEAAKYFHANRGRHGDD